MASSSSQSHAMLAARAAANNEEELARAFARRAIRDLTPMMVVDLYGLRWMPCARVLRWVFAQQALSEESHDQQRNHVLAALNGFVADKLRPPHALVFELNLPRQADVEEGEEGRHIPAFNQHGFVHFLTMLKRRMLDASQSNPNLSYTVIDQLHANGALVARSLFAPPLDELQSALVVPSQPLLSYAPSTSRGQPVAAAASAAAECYQLPKRHLQFAHSQVACATASERFHPYATHPPDRTLPPAHKTPTPTTTAATKTTSKTVYSAAELRRLRHREALVQETSPTCLEPLQRRLEHAIASSASTNGRPVAAIQGKCSQMALGILRKLCTVAIKTDAGVASPVAATTNTNTSSMPAHERVKQAMRSLLFACSRDATLLPALVSRALSIDEFLTRTMK